MIKKIESLYQDYKELRYLGKDFNEAINEFTFLKPFELVQFKILIENREKLEYNEKDKKNG